MQVIVRDGNSELRTINLESFGKDVVSFGRHPESDIVLKSGTVSRVHGCFYLENGIWHVKDLDSTNGITYNNGKIDVIVPDKGGIARISADDGMSDDFVEFKFINDVSKLDTTYTYVNSSILGQHQVMQEQYNVPAQQGMRCPKCGSDRLQIIQEQSSKGKDFSGAKGCCGAVLLGPIGILCGSCGKGKQIKTYSFWLCYNCGNKFKL